MDLITGATGFIGKHLATRLSEINSKGNSRTNVRILCRKDSEKKLPGELREKVEIVYGDLRDRASLIQATQGVTRIFHCAGHVSDWGSKSDFFATNVQGTHWLLEGAHQAKVQRFIHLSSIAAFGTPSPSYFDDSSPYGQSNDHYSYTKAAAEKLVFSFGKEKRLPVTVLRPTVVYGPEGTWLEEPLRMIEKDKMFLLGGGAGTCHPCYIKNLLDAILLSADHPRAVGQGYIVADDTPITFKEYFNAVAKIAGKQEIRRSIPLPIARGIASVCEKTAKLSAATTRPLLTHTAIEMVTAQSRLSMNKIKTELGFAPKYPFYSAMKELKNWYQAKNK